MNAFIQTGYGSANVISPAVLEVPVPAAGEVLVRIRAASLAAGDYLMMRGTPFPARLSVGFPKPKPNHVVGLDCAGVIEAVGEGVTGFEVGDSVYGECRGACAQYACAKTGRIAHMPASLSFEQAAAVPTSACTALQGLRDQARVGPGKRVLINGASGGVGTFAVQIANAYGAHVTGVCSTANVEMVRELGANEVIDYTVDDFTQGDARYDAIPDNVASHSLSATRRALVPGGIHVPSSGHGGMSWIIAAAVVSVFVREQGQPLVATTNSADLAALAQMIDAGAVAPVIEQVYPFDQTVEAFSHIDSGHARGKVVITVESKGQ